MDDSLYEQWLAQFVLRGDEAFSPGDKIPRQRPKAASEEERRERLRIQSRLHMRRKRARERANAGR